MFNLLIIREMQIKTILRYQHSLGWLLSKKEDEENNKWVKDVKELEPLYTKVGMWSGTAAIENSLVVP